MEYIQEAIAKSSAGQIHFRLLFSPELSESPKELLLA